MSEGYRERNLLGFEIVHRRFVGRALQTSAQKVHVRVLYLNLDIQ